MATKRRLIYADEARAAVLHENPAIAYCIDRIPSADAVEVVRCKDCKHHGGVTFGNRCKYWSNLVDGWVHFTNPDDFCSYGERRCKDGL